MKNQYSVHQILFVLLLALQWSCGSGSEDLSSASYREQIIFPLQQEHAHGPTIVELPNGDLLAAWFQGSGERWADDVRIMGIVWLLADGGVVHSDLVE